MLQRNEMRRINEALQFLIRKRTKAKHITEWKIGSQKTFCLNLAFQALEDQTSKLRDSAFMKEMQKNKLEREKESDKAQRMAEEIASNLDGLSEGHSRKSRSIYIIIKYRTRAIITRGLYTFYPLFEVHLCTVT